MISIISIIQNNQTVSGKPISTILNHIKHGLMKRKIRKLLNEPDEEKRKMGEDGLLAFTPYGLFHQKLDTNYFLSYSSLLLLEFPNVSKPNWQKVRHTACKSTFTYACFLNWDAQSLIVLVKTNASMKFHNLAFDKVRVYYERLLGVTADRNTGKLNFACPISFDKQIHINNKAREFPVLDRIQNSDKQHFSTKRYHRKTKRKSIISQRIIPKLRANRQPV
ncbi:MAG: hypothetical protein GY705_06130 [Bacteroidetes bacterium]|nr:hypothetical protein [Bacteroidota bacterium]